jgi:hypothetical protein
MDSIIQYVLGELKHVARFPAIFATAILVIAVAMWFVIWTAMDWRYSGIIANLHSDLDTAQYQRDDYKNKLSGATPDQAVQKIVGLEQRIRELEPKPDRYLTDDQKSKLVAALTPLAKEIGTIQIFSEGTPEAKQFARVFVRLFKQIGLNTTPLQSAGANSTKDRGLFEVYLLD